MTQSSVNSSGESQSEKTDIHVDLGKVHWEKLNRLADAYHGGNRTNSLRRAIDRLEAWHEEEADQRRTDDAQQKELAELGDTIETLVETVEKLERKPPIDEESRLPLETSSKEVERAAEKIYQVLGNADRPLSIDGIIEQTTFSIAVLGSGIELLDDKEMIQKVEGNQVTRYQLMPLE